MRGRVGVHPGRQLADQIAVTGDHEGQELAVVQIADRREIRARVVRIELPELGVVEDVDRVATHGRVTQRALLGGRAALCAVERERVRLGDQFRHQPRVQRQMGDQLAGVLVVDVVGDDDGGVGDRRIGEPAAAGDRWRRLVDHRDVHRRGERTRSAEERLPREVFVDARVEVEVEARPAEAPAERHCWNVRASTGAPSAAKAKSRAGQFCGVGANDSGTTMRSRQLQACPRWCRVRSCRTRRPTSPLWSLQFTPLLPGRAAACCTPPQFGTTMIEQGCWALQRRKEFSTLVSTWKYASPSPLRPVSVYVWLPTPCGAFASAAVKL